MRLLNTKSLELSRPYVPTEVPDYAILSHRWNTEEITFATITNTPILQLERQPTTKDSFAKIKGACEQAAKDGYSWIWIDSCCIDKSSSAELQECINSMWKYYAESNVCYVYLADVPDVEAGWNQSFAKSEWFARGWTLQELIAPSRVEFYAADWAAIGTKFERYKQIANITSIDSAVLVRTMDVDLFSTAERMSWAAHRNVTREEDEAYSLLGLFDVNMPLLYGEGRDKAFARLQEAIFNAYADHSIFLFRHSQYKRAHDAQPLLADSPTCFCDRIDCSFCPSGGPQNASSDFRYIDVLASERWSTQAHEQIMTTVTSLRNEMSTVLPLLAYQEVSSKLEYFHESKPRGGVSDVAVLNYTPGHYPQGAYCLLLRQITEDAFIRLQMLPAILPCLRDFEPRLKKTKVLICPGPTIEQRESHIDVLFSVNSDSFRVDTWDAKGSISHVILPTEAQKTQKFNIQTTNSKNSKRLVQVSCRISSSVDANLCLTIQLVRMHEIWSIREIFERKQGSRERKLRTMFCSSVPTDRCSVKCPDGETLVVQIRRLAGTARARGKDSVIKDYYQLLVNYR